MKKKLMAAIGAVAIFANCAHAEITITLPEGSDLTELKYVQVPVQKYANAKTQAETGIEQLTAKVEGNKVVVKIGEDQGGYMYNFMMGPRTGMEVYAYPGENIDVKVSSLQPLDYTATGSATMDAYNEVTALSKPIMKRQAELTANGNTPTEKQLRDLYNDYNSAMKEFVEENPTSVAAVFAAMNLQGEDMLNAFARLSERAKASIPYPLLAKSAEQTKQMIEKERAREALSNGQTQARNFTFENTEGKNVSLTEFRGKWVILDFWGSWCGWCIKGFPELKEAYAKYKDRLEVIGLDCNETKEAWLAGVKKYELPWVNLYVPKADLIFNYYGVTGFPTKVIIDPEGIIRNVTAGHDPKFFEVLDQLMAK